MQSLHTLKSTLILTTAATGVGVCTALSPAGNNDANSVLYRLVENQTLMAQGCIPPCLCPVLFQGQISGTFVLTSESITGTFNEYIIEDIDWTITNFNDDSLPITGSGSYTLFKEFAVTERMQLELTIADDKPIVFDSGIVVTEPEFPVITITVSVGDFVCFDNWISLTAEPHPADLNGDGCINQSDLGVMLAAYNVSAAGDMNGDGATNQADLGVMLGDFGRGCE